MSEVKGYTPQELLKLGEEKNQLELAKDTTGENNVTTLLPCPFCGVELKRWGYMPKVFFEHPYNGCILSGKKVVESEHDIKSWNTRKPMEEIRKELDNTGYVKFSKFSKLLIAVEEVVKMIEKHGGVTNGE